MHTWPEDPQGTAWTGDGGYRLDARSPSQFVAVRAPLTDVPDDIVVTASFRKTGGPSGGGYGLILRDQWTSAGDGVDQSGQYFVAEVNDTGQFGIWRRNADRWAELQPWTPSTAVHPDAGVNELTAQLLGERMSFLVNGTGWPMWSWRCRLAESACSPGAISTKCWSTSFVSRYPGIRRISRLRQLDHSPRLRRSARWSRPPRGQRLPAASCHQSRGRTAISCRGAAGARPRGWTHRRRWLADGHVFGRVRLTTQPRERSDSPETG